MLVPQECQAHAAPQDSEVAQPNALADFGADAINQEIEQEACGVGRRGDCCKGGLHWAATIGPQQSCLHCDHKRRRHCMEEQCQSPVRWVVNNVLRGS